VEHTSNRYLVWSGLTAIVGAIIHLAAIVGGPSWYSFIGAPNSIVHLAAIGHPYPAIACVVIASILFVLAAYAFSGAGLVRRLPFVRITLVLISTILVVRGISFIPLMMWRPALFSDICNCNGVDSFLVVTSAICLAGGLAFAVGTCKAWGQLNDAA
jgi:putative oxidoreductase